MALIQPVLLHLIGEVRVKGKAKAVTLCKAYNGNPGGLKVLKHSSREILKQAVHLFQLGFSTRHQVYLPSVWRNPQQTQPPSMI